MGTPPPPSGDVGRQGSDDGIAGAILVGFVIFHMLGNVKIYEGEPNFNAYAAYLRIVGVPP